MRSRLVSVAAIVLAMAAVSTTEAVSLTVGGKSVVGSSAKQNGNVSASSPWGVFKNDTVGLIDIPARRMWGWGPGLHGYCGSQSFQMAGIFFGNWVSEQLVRYAAGDAEVLIGANADLAAKHLKYEFEEWNFNREKTPQSTEFIKWVKGEVDLGHVVIVGWYERKPGGDEDYDHIMPVVGYQLDAHSGEVNGLWHHDLFLNDTTFTHGDELRASRSWCSQTENPVLPYDFCLPNKYDYGISIKNIVDTSGELYRTQLTAPPGEWYEPNWGKEDQVHDAPKPWKMTAIVSGLTVGDTYTVLRFDAPESVPTSDYMNGAYTNYVVFTAKDTVQHVHLVEVMSSGSHFYRTVKGTPAHHH